MPDDASPPAPDPILPASQPAPGWYPDGRGDSRWWDGRGWTDNLVGPQPHQLAASFGTPATASARRGRVGWWVAGGVIAALLVFTAAAVAVFGPASNTVARVAREALAGNTAGTPGYYTFTGPAGLPMQVGAPWGRACVPVVLNVQDHVPDLVYAEVVRVVAEARAAGLNIAVETRRHTWRPDDVYPAGMRNKDVEFVPVFADTDEGHLRSDGEPARHDVGWDAVVDADGRHEHMTGLSDTLHMATLGDSPLEYRRALRKLVGWSQGISHSTEPASVLPLRNPSAPDAFSAADIAAMKVMSGCAGG